MARCEDWPCCGHESGCCPDYDESGKQLNMRCVCGAVVPLGSRSSLCPSCLRRGDPEDEGFGYDGDPDEGGDECDEDCENCRNSDCPNRESDGDDSMDGDHASALASCGFGTDEDYGGGDTPMGDDYGGE